MPESVKIVFGLLGGLALFLYGMNSMSEALQKAAGEKMKKILSFLTKTPVSGALAGALVTAILQSSSATTVMVIGFVSAGLMGLPQAISVIFGANIGTTMTAQLIAFNISDYIYPIIFIGFIVNFLSKREKVKNIAMVVFSFGLLFEGISIMSSVMKPLAASPFFTNLMGRVSNQPVLGVLVGMCMTLVVQSSSATIAVLQSFAQQPGADGIHSVIGLSGAIPILLGDNIGTTITALLASIGQSKNAKRTAIAHSCFNISGTLVALPLLPLFIKWVQFISPRGNELEIISRQIANAHTTFNVVCTLVWLPLIHVMVKIVMAIIPGEDTADMAAGKSAYLDKKMVGQPMAAMYLVSKEIERCLGSTERLFALMRDEIAGKHAVKAEDSFDTAYENAKHVQQAIIDYISEMFSIGSMNQEQSEEAAGFLAVINDIDRVSDRCNDIVRGSRTAYLDGHPFSADAVAELNNCVDAAKKMFGQAMAMLKEGSYEEASRIVKAKSKLRKSVKAFNKAHLARVKAGKCDEAMTPIYSNILYNMERMGDNCVSIAEECLDDVHLVKPEDAGMKPAVQAQ